jgi:carboxymethylenebutenolidase
MAAVPGAVADPTRLHLAEVTVDSRGTPLAAHLARPVDAGVRPGVIVIHEAMGLNDHIRDVANRFANLGYDALAPDLYTREGAPGADMAAIMGALFAMPDDRVVTDLDACAAHLRALDSSSGKVGCIGFCSGGRQTLLFACSSRAVDAAVDCWGGYVQRATPDEETTPMRPQRVIDLLGGVQCPVYLVGGAEDKNPSPEILDDVRARLEALGRQVRMDVFDGAGHAFFADYRPSYREQAAFALWPRIVEFFDSTLR